MATATVMGANSLQNFVISILVVAFVVLPEVLADATADERRREQTRSRKEVPPEMRSKATEWSVFSHCGGYLRFSPLFYGFADDNRGPKRFVRLSATTVQTR